VAAARNPADVEDLAQAYPDLVRPVALDVTDLAGTERAVGLAVREFGRVDVLFNNAGYGLIGGIEEISAEELQRQFAVNVFGA